LDFLIGLKDLIRISLLAFQVPAIQNPKSKIQNHFTCALTALAPGFGISVSS
jgi:hypothetical protein